MENRTLVLLFAPQVPLFTALVGMIIEAVSLQDSITVREKHVKQMLLCYFAVFIAIGCGVSTGLALPALSVWLWPLTIFSLYMAPVLYYRFVVVLTDTGRKEPSRQGRLYLLPALVATGCVLLYFLIPFDIRLRLLEGESINDFVLTAFLFFTTPVIQFVLTIIYMGLACRRLQTYYRQNREKDVLWESWFRLSLALCLLSLLWSGAFFLTIWRETFLWALPLAAVAAWGQAVFLCCHSFSHRSLLFLPLSLAPVPLKMPFGERLSEGKGSGEGNRVYRRWTAMGDPVEVEPAPLTRKMFERQVVGKKLFLNPQLRLSDLMKLFHTNRTYLSGFINREYGYGFNGYINRLRLAELERLMALPSNRGKSVSKFYARAGFSSYQMYLRIKREVKGESGSPGSTDTKDTDL